MNQPSSLDLSHLAYSLPSFQKRKTQALDRIKSHLASNGGYVAWSGGRDSTAVVALAREIDSTVPIVWFDSGLEYPENREYILRVTKMLDLNLTVIKASPDALTVLRNSGAWDHSMLYSQENNIHNILITQPSDEAHRMFGVGELSGLRAEESTGRRALLAPKNGTYNRSNGNIVCAPCWSWSSNDVRSAIAGAKIPENPVYEKLARLGAPARAQRVGLVVDGNNPDHGRYTYLKNGWPTLWAELTSVLPRLNEWR
jgi:phosphoadenosine phosphosulfate reductase